MYYLYIFLYIYILIQDSNDSDLEETKKQQKQQREKLQPVLSEQRQERHFEDVDQVGEEEEELIYKQGQQSQFSLSSSTRTGTNSAEPTNTPTTTSSGNHLNSNNSLLSHKNCIVNTCSCNTICSSTGFTTKVSSINRRSFSSGSIVNCNQPPVGTAAIVGINNNNTSRSACNYYTDDNLELQNQQVLNNQSNGGGDVIICKTASTCNNTNTSQQQGLVVLHQDIIRSGGSGSGCVVINDDIITSSLASSGSCSVYNSFNANIISRENRTNTISDYTTCVDAKCSECGCRNHNSKSKPVEKCDHVVATAQNNNYYFNRRQRQGQQITEEQQQLHNQRLLRSDQDYWYGSSPGYDNEQCDCDVPPFPLDLVQSGCQTTNVKQDKGDLKYTCDYDDIVGYDNSHDKGVIIVGQSGEWFDNDNRNYRIAENICDIYKSDNRQNRNWIGGIDTSDDSAYRYFEENLDYNSEIGRDIDHLEHRLDIDKDIDCLEWSLLQNKRYISNNQDTDRIIEEEHNNNCSNKYFDCSNISHLDETGKI